jgi:hypothetical protein
MKTLLGLKCVALQLQAPVLDYFLDHYRVQVLALIQVTDHSDIFSDKRHQP